MEQRGFAGCGYDRWQLVMRADSTTVLYRWFGHPTTGVRPENRPQVCLLSYYPAPLAVLSRKTVSLNSPRPRSSPLAVYRFNAIVSSDETPDEVTPDGVASMDSA